MNIYYTPIGIGIADAVKAIQVTPECVADMNNMNPQFKYPLRPTNWVVYGISGSITPMSNRKFTDNYEVTADEYLPQVTLQLRRVVPGIASLLRKEPRIIVKSEDFARKEEALYSKLDAMLGANK